MKWLREEAKGEEMENTREPLRRPPYVAQVVETVDHFLLFDTISPRGIVSSVLDPIERGLIMASYVNQRGQTEPRRARAPRRAVERVISPPPWSPAKLRCAPSPPPRHATPLSRVVPAVSRPISGGIQG